MTSSPYDATTEQEQFPSATCKHIKIHRDNGGTYHLSMKAQLNCLCNVLAKDVVVDGMLNGRAPGLSLMAINKHQMSRETSGTPLGNIERKNSTRKRDYWIKRRLIELRGKNSTNFCPRSRRCINYGMASRAPATAVLENGYIVGTSRQRKEAPTVGIDVRLKMQII